MRQEASDALDQNAVTGVSAVTGPRLVSASGQYAPEESCPAPVIGGGTFAAPLIHRLGQKPVDISLALIGLGEIGKGVAEHAARLFTPRLAAALVRSSDPRLDSKGSIFLTDSIDVLLEQKPDVVIEAAGHDAVRLHAHQIVGAGCDLMIVSTGPLAEDEFCSSLLEVAETSGSKIIVPAGAIGGLDALGALARGGLESVAYTSIKPPKAWRGTPAANRFDLETLTEQVEIFRGSAREAALLFPQNANVAATVALGGAGFDKTEVVLIADPHRSDNIGRIEARGPQGQLFLELTGPAMEGNPKSSQITALSLVHMLENRWNSLVI